MLDKRISSRNTTIAACFVGNFVSATPMVTTVFGFFLVPIAVEFGWPRARVSVALAIIALTGALSYPIVGRLADRYGTRRLVLIGILLFAANIMALSRLPNSALAFYCLYALLGVVAALPSPMLFSKVISGSFRQRRGFLLGLTVGGGNGAGATIMSVVTPLLIVHYGWRGAYLGIGLLTVALGFPILYVWLRDPSRSRDSEPSLVLAGDLNLPQARKTVTFWMILVAITVGAGCTTAVFSHVVAMLTDRGIGIERAGSVVTVFALTSVCWQVTVGYVLDRVQSPKIAAPFFCAGVAGLLLLQHATAPGALYSSAVLMGIALGTEYGVLPYYIARYFGVSSYGVIYGVIYSTVTLAVGFTPFLMDMMYDRSGTYEGAAYAVSAAMLLGSALIFSLKPYPKVGAGNSASAAFPSALEGSTAPGPG